MKLRGMLLLVVFGLAGILMLARCGYSNDYPKGQERMQSKTKILLIGASVGQAWNLRELPLRMKDNDHLYESIAVWQYDKTGTLEEVLIRPKRKFRFTKTYIKSFFQPSPQLPDVIIMKECAAYFPGDLNVYKELMSKWVKRIKDADIKLIIATVAPVTRKHAEQKKGRMEQIQSFNDWARKYAETEKIPLLDLQAVLRENGPVGFLKDEFTSGDGLHLNKKAYDVLDKLLADLLRNHAAAAHSKF